MTGVVQLCEVRSFWDLVVVSAMIQQGQVGSPARRVLVVANTGDVPETSVRIQENPGFARLAAGFDAVIDYNAAIHPLHPGDWRPQRFEEPLWQRGLRSLWDLGDGPLELVVENVQSPPGLALGLVFADARVIAYYDNLRSLALSPGPFPVRLGTRMDAVLHLDLRRGRPPRQFAEWQVPASRIDAATVRKIHRSAGAGVVQRLLWDPALGIPRLVGPRLFQALRVLRPRRPVSASR